MTQVGREHPNPETIPHLSPTTSNAGNGSMEGQNGHRTSISGPPGSLGDGVRLPPALQQMGSMKSGSPVKESSMMHRSVSADEQDEDDSEGSRNRNASRLTEAERDTANGVSPPPQREGMPIRGTQ